MLREFTITIDGIRGSGKTTLLEQIAIMLKEKGFATTKIKISTDSKDNTKEEFKAIATW